VILRRLLLLLLLLPLPGLAAEIAERDALFAWHRMAGTEPDLRFLAEEEVAARPMPPEPPRDPEAERRYLTALALRRQRAAFAGFDPDGPFDVTIETAIAGYDRERGGMPVDTAPLRGVFLRDPTGRLPGFHLRFRNVEALSVIPAGEAEEAAGALRRAGLASVGDWAGMGRVTIRFAFAGAAPRLSATEEIGLLAEILSARVEGPAGEALHVFPRIGSVAAAAAARQAGPAPLREASLAGIRIGMAMEGAGAAARAAHPVAFGDAFFDGLPDAVMRGLGRPDCSAGMVADILAFRLPLAAEDSFGACLALRPGDPAGELAGEVAEIAALRFLPGALADEVRTDLQERLGPPLAETPWGELVWVGPEAAAGTPLLELRAIFARVAEGGPAREPGALLAMTLRRYVPPAEDGS
jgi:hypothetical protein